MANSEVVHVQEPLAFLHKETTAAKFLFCWLTQLVRVSKSRGNTAKDEKRWIRETFKGTLLEYNFNSILEYNWNSIIRVQLKINY